MKTLLRSLTFCLILVARPEARAFTFSSTDPLQQGWAERPLRFYINRTNCPTDIDALIARSLSLWNAVPESALQIELGADSTQTAADILNQTATQVPLIVCDSNFSADVGADGDVIPGVGLIAGTSFRPIRFGGLILNAETSTDGYIGDLNADIAAVVVAHEIGHVLGIGHSSDPSALMYYDASAKGTLSLAQDDIDAAVFLYPRNEVSHFGMFGGCGAVLATHRGGNGDDPPGPGGGNSLVLFAGLYGLWAAARRAPGRRAKR